MVEINSIRAKWNVGLIQGTKVRKFPTRPTWLTSSLVSVVGNATKDRSKSVPMWPAQYSALRERGTSVSRWMAAGCTTSHSFHIINFTHLFRYSFVVRHVNEWFVLVNVQYDLPQITRTNIIHKPSPYVIILHSMYPRQNISDHRIDRLKQKTSRFFVTYIIYIDAVCWWWTIYCCGNPKLLIDSNY
jgi:hypothetical protein